MSAPTLAAELRLMADGRDPGRSHAPAFPAVLLDAADRIEELEEALETLALMNPTQTVGPFADARAALAKVRP
jgi:hypothetical protein